MRFENQRLLSKLRTAKGGNFMHILGSIRATGYAAVLTLGLTPIHASAQQYIFMDCKPTTKWEKDDKGNGEWGLTFIFRAGPADVHVWKSETRTWKSSISCPPDDILARNGVVTSCEVSITEGQIKVRRSSRWPSGSSSLAHLIISRVSGAFEFDSYMTLRGDPPVRTWFEAGICGPGENPETKATPRVF